MYASPACYYKRKQFKRAREEKMTLKVFGVFFSNQTGGYHNCLYQSTDYCKILALQSSLNKNVNIIRLLSRFKANRSLSFSMTSNN
jgi:hypothetical protein